MLSSAFWTADPRTRGLSALAACLLLRATSESLAGLLQKSPRAMAAAHTGSTAEQVLEAIDELERRELARWWPDDEVLVVRGYAAEAKGSAAKSARMLLAQHPPDVGRYAMATGGGDGGSDRGSHPGCQPKDQDQDQDQEASGYAVRSLPLGLALVEPPPAKRPRKPKRDHGAEVEAVLQRIDEHRTRLGETPLPPYKRDPATIRARLNDDGVDLALVLAVVDARAEDCERTPGQLDYLDATSPFTKAAEGKGGWPVSLRMLERRAKSGSVAPSGSAPFGVNPTTGKPYRSDAERRDVERLRDAGRAIVAERKGGAR